MDDYGINAEQGDCGKPEKYNPLQWRMTIVKVQNGYILQEGPATEATYSVVEEDQDKEENEAETFAGRSMLLAVMEYFNLFGSKHNKFRINLTIDGEEVEEEGDEE